MKIIPKINLQNLFIKDNFVKLQNYPKNKRSQTALEFIFMFSFLFILFIGMMSMLGSRLHDVKQENEFEQLRSMQDFIFQELKLAKTVGNGYNRVFELPETIGSEMYEIRIENKKSLVITLNEKEFTKSLPFNIEGEIQKGKNIITKNNNIISLNIQEEL